MLGKSYTASPPSLERRYENHKVRTIKDELGFQRRALTLDLNTIIEGRTYLRLQGTPNYTYGASQIVQVS